MFKAAGFFSAGIESAQTIHADGSRTDIPHAFDPRWEQPTEPVTLWRGSALDRGRSLSWTVHRECASRFADATAGLGFEAGIFRAVVPARAVLAAFGDEREQEFVVNPNMLTRDRIALTNRLPARALPTLT
jgi:hypothetical protein